jgi:hypothetical protein
MRNLAPYRTQTAIIGDYKISGIRHRPEPVPGPIPEPDPPERPTPPLPNPPIPPEPPIVIGLISIHY